MTVAFTFPGQGSQAVGMGQDLARDFSEARAVFAEVDEALGQNLSDIIFNGPQEELTLTANAQPALLAASMAIVRVMEARGLAVKDTASFVAGHSLGEYCALCAAGSFSLADAARLLRIRGEAMQAAVPPGEGAMAAIIGLEQGDVEAVCAAAAHQQAGSCQIANDNGGGQLVISGIRQAVEKAVALARKKGARKAVMLQVSAPFHSALMAPAAEAMRKALSRVEIDSPTVPLVANVRAEPVTEPGGIAALLVEQVTGRVRWRESIEWLRRNGVTSLYEIGPGKVLTGLARRIDRSMTAVSVNDAADIDRALAALLD